MPCAVCFGPHKPSTCFHPRDFTGTAGTERGQSVSVCVCELGADGPRPSMMGKQQSLMSMARVKDSCGQKAEWMAE